MLPAKFLIQLAIDTLRMQGLSELAAIVAVVRAVEARAEAYLREEKRP